MLKYTVALTLAWLVLTTALVRSDKRLTINVTPSVARAPAYVTVLTSIQADDDNRSIEVTADSGDYYRRSVTTLDGHRAPPANEFIFKDLPEGRYEVTVALYGTQGPRAVETAWLSVAAGVGR
jgi:hypothetical protein